MNYPNPNPDLLTADQSAVWDELIWRRGQRYAITGAELQRRTRLRDYQVKAAVRGLRLQHKIPIGASRGKLNGYYLIDTPAEMAATIRVLRRQALSELALICALAGHEWTRYREMLGQLGFEFGDLAPGT
jgi:hypothetical protein